MKRIIEIPELLFEKTKENGYVSELNLEIVWDALKNSTPLNEVETEDCISRQDVLKEIVRFSTEEGSSVECQQLYYDVYNMPSVTPKSDKPSGKWIRQANDYVDYYECSNCGMAVGRYDVKNYCPNCGSRNVVEEQGEDT